MSTASSTLPVPLPVVSGPSSTSGGSQPGSPCFTSAATGMHDFLTVQSMGALDELPVLDDDFADVRPAERYPEAIGWCATGAVMKDVGKAYENTFEAMREEHDSTYLKDVVKALKAENRETSRYRKKQFAKMNFVQKFRSTLGEFGGNGSHIEMSGEATNEYAVRGSGVYSHVHRELHKSFEKLVLVNSMRGIQRAIAKSTGDESYVTPRLMSRALRSGGANSKVQPSEPQADLFEHPRFNADGLPCTVHEYRALVVKNWKSMQKLNSAFDRAYEGADGTHFRAIRISPIVKIIVYDNRETLDLFEWQPKEEQILAKKVASILRRANKNTARFRNRRWVWVDHEPIMRQDGYDDVNRWVADKLPKQNQVMGVPRLRRISSSRDSSSMAFVETEGFDFDD